MSAERVTPICRPPRDVVYPSLMAAFSVSFVDVACSPSWVDVACSPSVVDVAWSPLFVAALFSPALPGTTLLPSVMDVAVVRVVGAVVDCLAAVALSRSVCAAGGVFVSTVSRTSARPGGVVVVTASATAGPVPFTFFGPVDVGAESPGGVEARLNGTAVSWEATVGSETTETDSVEAAAAGLIAAGAGWDVITRG